MVAALLHISQTLPRENVISGRLDILNSLLFRMMKQIGAGFLDIY